nr:MAG TPA: hypothetical protein [Caudoviricetes sp.]
MKYNKSEIMKAAWSLYKMAQKWVSSLSFSECLHRAWANAKKAIINSKKILSDDCCKMIHGCLLGIKYTIVGDCTMGWLVTGKTYAARKELKAAGFEWDPYCKQWYTTDRKVAERFC